ncbi:MAG: hypothetical protein U0Z26_03715 [Anaerolineales bacterium]
MEGEFTVGGGSLPGESMPTFLLSLEAEFPGKIFKAVKKSSPPVIARTVDDKICLIRVTVLPEQEGALMVILKNLLGSL